MPEWVDVEELSRRALELVGRAAEGEAFEVVRAGRVAARLMPTSGRTWRRWDVIAPLFFGPPDPQWTADQAQIAARGPL